MGLMMVNVKFAGFHLYTLYPLACGAIFSTAERDATRDDNADTLYSYSENNH